MQPDPARAMLRHTVAALAYRAGKALRSAPASFATFVSGPDGRTPTQILAHMGDLFDWAHALARGEKHWADSEPLPWPQEVARFHATLLKFDALLASDMPLAAPVERLFQGPVADALTHTGQLTMLRRMSGAAIRGENYFQADITIGRVGPEQAAPRREL
jgi:hypothetical protein